MSAGFNTGTSLSQAAVAPVRYLGGGLRGGEAHDGGGGQALGEHGVGGAGLQGLCVRGGGGVERLGHRRDLVGSGR